ncbi:AraC family transcriptional regulator [Vibrio sp. V27_P1S3P104]|uniref:AraC family transcriptional regulator n=1 Tax=unclassified Vibrio TaxID=2614977 RepID=UPI001372EE22|nr:MULTISPECIES: AraC family transcriptional regulator [unclassified Vibrio]NAW69306.1 AraC family transcriptional regulator [Vibrio sp. V28_P6S34P95]NAX05645.1 AraC family transcriptional regulator [Vibrio sp. V30_P3S12P165]NAX33737.1 AraC family transcriptional regulator [Vibrio sp. V29_P1S30P107]NAX38372.1 AraC family transcriptional regulator [Vibrio sp. V27_P1S3P104]NAX41362.1 AraC family transcriptional regulator [Vibrio sp. V26_P1S5P106]
MNYAIQSETCTFPYLQVTARKRAIKHSLIQVNQGLVLFKLGKQEYAIEAHQALWIPLDCLSALTFFPNTQITKVDFSVRLPDSFPRQAGVIRHSDLSLAVIHRLRENSSTNAVYPHLHQVLKYEVQNFEPKLKMSALSQALSLWCPMQSGHVSKEQHVVLLVREALKRRLSGVKEKEIVDQLFSGQLDQYYQLCQLTLGGPLG